MITVDCDGVFFWIQFCFFPTEIKTKRTLPFLEHLNRKEKEVKSTYIILLLSVELSSAILIALTTDHIVYSNTSYVQVQCTLNYTHQLNRKILKQWNFQQSLNFHQKTEALQFVGHNR